MCQILADGNVYKVRLNEFVYSMNGKSSEHYVSRYLMSHHNTAAHVFFSPLIAYYNLERNSIKYGGKK